MRVTLYKAPGLKITVDDRKLPQGDNFFARWDKGKRLVEDVVKAKGVKSLPDPIEELWKQAS